MKKYEWSPTGSEFDGGSGGGVGSEDFYEEPSDILGSEGQDQGQREDNDVIEYLVKNKGEKFRDPKEVAKAYVELEKAHGRKITDSKQMEEDLVKLYGFYQTFNPYVNDVKTVIYNKDPIAFEKIFGTEELNNMKNSNGQGDGSPVEAKGVQNAKEMLDAFKKDPEGVRQTLLDILGPTLQPLQKTSRSLSISKALDMMEKDINTFPYFNKVAKEMESILNNLPDEMVPKTMEGYKYLYEAAVGRNANTIWEEKKKGLKSEIYKDISEKGFEIEPDEGSLPDNYGSSTDREVMDVVNARSSKL